LSSSSSIWRPRSDSVQSVAPAARLGWNGEDGREKRWEADERPAAGDRVDGAGGESAGDEAERFEEVH